MKKILVLLAVPFLLTACGDSDKPGAAGSDSVKASASTSDTAAGATASTTSSSSTAESSSAAAVANPYDVKSGIVEMKNTMANGTQILYFDDYGRKQAIHIDMDVMGKKMQSVQLVTDGWVYSYDPQSKAGQKMPEPKEGLLPVPEPATLTDQKKKEFNYRELEPREVVGKQAQGYSMEMAQAPGSPSMAMRTWRWKRVPLRMEMEMPGSPAIITEVIKAEFDVDVPADKFSVPADIKFVEQKMPAAEAGAASSAPAPGK